MELYISFLCFLKQNNSRCDTMAIFLCTTFVVQQQLQQVAEKLTNFQKCFFTAFIGNFFMYLVVLSKYNYLHKINTRHTHQTALVNYFKYNNFSVVVLRLTQLSFYSCLYKRSKKNWEFQSFTFSGTFRLITCFSYLLMILLDCQNKMVLHKLAILF